MLAEIILLSGSTDIADIIIPCKFNMVFAFGKILNLIADKLTQVTFGFMLAAQLVYELKKYDRYCQTLKKSNRRDSYASG